MRILKCMCTTRKPRRSAWYETGSTGSNRRNGIMGGSQSPKKDSLVERREATVPGVLTNGKPRERSASRGFIGATAVNQLRHRCVVDDLIKQVSFRVSQS